MFKSFNRRAFVSLSLFLSFGIMLVTSIWMFVKAHTTLIAMLHTIIGFGLLLVVFWHIKNNVAALKQYCQWRTRTKTTQGAAPTFNLALPVAVVITAMVAGLSLIQFAPLNAFYNWGNTLRAGDKMAETLELTYMRVDKVPATATGNRLTIDLRKGPYFKWPQYAIWLETLDGEFIQPLYITEKLAQNKFSNKVTKRNPNQVFTSDPFTSPQAFGEIFELETDPVTNDQRIRPESLPVFLHQLGMQTSTGVFVPTDNNAAKGTSSAIDAYSGATMRNNFLLAARAVKPLPDSYRVRVELNQSFDYNTFYSSDRFPDDPVYSGNGYTAQPSVVYEAVIDTRSSQRYYPMQLIGRGHHSGKDGKLYGDMENLTTATEIVDRIIVEIESN